MENAKIEQLYVHIVSGDTQSLADWRADFESMDIESWYGLPAEECKGCWIQAGKLVPRLDDYMSGMDAADIQNDIDRPDWVGVEEMTDSIKVWDKDTASAQLGFYVVN
jgi:hypothetical protein